jgi:hypothetical protein
MGASSIAYLQKRESYRLLGMVDIELLVEALRKHGHRVETVTSVPENAGEYELTVDGEVLNLEEARAVLERDDNKTT